MLEFYALRGGGGFLSTRHVGDGSAEVQFDARDSERCLAQEASACSRRGSIISNHSLWRFRQSTHELRLSVGGNCGETWLPLATQASCVRGKSGGYSRLANSPLPRLSRDP